MCVRRYVPQSGFKNFVALVMAAVTAGAWIPFANLAGHDEHTEDDESSSVPGPVFEPHPFPTWAEKAVPRPVDLVKHPKPVHNPATDPTHARPTPKQTVHPTPKPVVRPVTPPPLGASASQTLVLFLRAQLGKPYVLGGNGPNVFDCSGLTKAAYARIGHYLPRTSQQQSLVGVRVSMDDLHIGDLLFWGTPGYATHVAIYIGHDKFIAAQNPLVGIVERSVDQFGPLFSPNFARRIL